MSIRKAARIQGFLDSFKYKNVAGKYKIVGNAVPPLLVRAIAESIYSVLAKAVSAETLEAQKDVAKKPRRHTCT